MRLRGANRGCGGAFSPGETIRTSAGYSEYPADVLMFMFWADGESDRTVVYSAYLGELREFFRDMDAVHEAYRSAF